ncbi:nucleotidyltransferase domain-containing protein [Aphanothece sacrum]|uniref:Nucleotidyltransferase domain-containing protein n=1 Tax=Aphanothece sacrum FPU1 TaxID=1920663 RepID=A0A401ILE4_APHSA|nr:nucleotidyltransferase domain-containing protein [Aphanothece sacrum]GBF82058.1 nucleotidyltransferase domain-containing protein [Aphanothece sacrum FPU1]GBF85871.1 nucleotidyltransferase [Aphanothece sacrum FPU3]
MNKSHLKLILQEIKQCLLNFYKDQLNAIILYGSQAREDAKEFSDIDILVILKSDINPYHEIDQTSQIISEICLNYDVVISRHFISSTKFQTENNPFFYNVKKEGIIL